jgi:5-methylcytosine-specific restriction endonuclease McrA
VLPQGSTLFLSMGVGKPNKFVVKARKIKDSGYSERSRLRLRILYHKYLLTDEWFRIRNAVLIRDKHKCVKCGAKTNLTVHHTDYMFIYEEHRDLSLLITLCKECHKKIHRLSK